MRTNQDVVFELWCRLTGQTPSEVGAEERAAFLACSQVDQLSTLPYPQLLDAGISAASRGSLPLERWLEDVHA